MAERKNSEARIRANNKYNEKAYDRINIAVPKGKKAEIQALAESRGQSVNAFVNEAIDAAVSGCTAQTGGDTPLPARALTEDSRLERAPRAPLTYGVALDSEKATCSPKKGTLEQTPGAQ